MPDPGPTTAPTAHPQLVAQLHTIFTIPLELTHRILTSCHPWDIAAFSRTCRLAHDLVQDEYLWRQLWHLYPFDDPQAVLKHRHAVNLPISPDLHPSGSEWKDVFTRRLKAELVATMKRGDLSLVSLRDKKDALQVFVSIIEEGLPAPGDLSTQGMLTSISVSKNIQWLERVLSKSKLIAPSIVVFDSPPETGQLQAHIRSCIGDAEWANKSRRQMSDRRNKSRAYVYDLRNYDSKNDYGPFRISGDVNWVHAEHLINVVLANLRDLPQNLTHARPPSSLESLRPYTAPGKYSPQDWAGIEGTWRRYVCFMDYRDLFAFNYSDIADGPLHPKFFEDPRFREATKLIEVKLRIIPEAEIRFFESSEVLPSASPHHPPIFFAGSSKGVHGNEAVVEGYVRMACDGTARWRFKVSIYDQSPQWSSNGVQLGNVGSARGVIGVWTTTTHEQGDPVGPFWLFKVEDDYSENLMEYT
ncbi:hypothetical protein P691DRAFT_754120 [Macrolepiota fuliginosa MF-IS2]|uniref:F-box domain-containing protein n=1 Tax=Macrolepiota fuliginosa MF-IS2 TaxID=1400762 RepID=A0A9P5XQD7_9AGAR|nr:hypothetical protein P691DRAFT_754120 [Macrolepiota fuliginosa MF-IS2]